MDKDNQEFSMTYKILGNCLSKSKEVTKYDSPTEKEAWTMSHALLDIQESCLKYTNLLLPKLMNQNLDEAQINDLLFEIGEEFRHILYHVNDTEYYQYLFPLDRTR